MMKLFCLVLNIHDLDKQQLKPVFGENVYYLKPVLPERLFCLACVGVIGSDLIDVVVGFLFS